MSIVTITTNAWPEHGRRIDDFGPCHGLSGLRVCSVRHRGVRTTALEASFFHSDDWEPIQLSALPKAFRESAKKAIAANRAEVEALADSRSVDGTDRLSAEQLRALRASREAWALLFQPADAEYLAAYVAACADVVNAFSKGN